MNVYNLEKLFELCLTRASIGNLSIAKIINDQILEQSWQALVRWVRYQVDLGRGVCIPNFATYSGQLSHSETILHTQFDPDFLFEAKIKTVIDETKVQKYPSVKLNFNNIAKFTHIEPQLLTQSISSILSTLEYLIKSDVELLEIDTDPFGKIIINDRVLYFQPTVKKATGQKLGQNTVKSLLRTTLGKTGMKMENSLIPNQKNMEDMEKSSVINENKKLVQERYFASSQQNQSIFQNNSYMVSPTRRYKISPANLTNDMLGAGTDPLALKQDFSILAGDGILLIDASFVRPPFAQIKCPPILDIFSRTLAAPIGSQYNSLSVSARIALFYTPSAKYLHMDHETGCVTYLKISENQTKLTANQELLQEIATADEEILYTLAPKSFPNLEKKVQGRRTCYERYKQYITYEIPNEAVAPIKQEYMTQMMMKVPPEYIGLDQNSYHIILENVRIEINNDYISAVKKAIFDYILKDENESLKVGVLEILDYKVADYGESQYNGILSTPELRKRFKKKKEKLGGDKEGRSMGILNCYGPGTYEISKIWGKIESERYLILPKKDDKQQSIADFMELQQEKIQKIRSYLAGPWGREILDVFRKEMMNKDKNKFFSSIAIMMHNQMRQLIDVSLQEYRKFILMFKKENYCEAYECIEKDLLPEKKLESSFLVLKVIEDNKKIILETSTDKIKQDLVRLVIDIIKTSHKLPRAENTIARTEKNITEVSPNEPDYVKLKADIEDVLTNTLNLADDALKVYKPYEWIFYELDKLLLYLNSTNISKTRKEILEKIDGYKKIIDEIHEKLPIEIHLNLVLLDSKDLKRHIMEILNELILKIEHWIVTHCHTECTIITSKITDIMEFLAKSASSEEVLVQLEQRLEKIKDHEQKIITKDLFDVVEWVKLYYSLAYSDEDEKNFLQIVYTTAQTVLKLPNDLERHDNEIRNYREDIEKKLIDKRHFFIIKITDLYQSIDKLKKEQRYFKQDDVKNAIEEYETKLKEYETEMEEINQREKLIGFGKTEFTQLQLGQQNLHAFVELKNLSHKINVEKTDSLRYNFDNTNIFKLNPEPIEKEIKKMDGTFEIIRSEFKTMVPLPKNALDFLEGECKTDIDYLKKNVVILKYLCNPGLQERHWKEINEEFAQQGLHLVISPDSADTKLRNLIRGGVEKALNKLTLVSEKASKEFSNQRVLEKMDEDWVPQKFELIPWKETGTFAIKGSCVDDLTTILDDHLIKIQTMKGSPYARPFEEKINMFESSITFIQDSLEIWLKVQGLWIYLEPIFTSEDISRSLPEEHSKFKEIDQEYRFMMQKIAQQGKVMDLPKNKRFLEVFKNAFIVLEGIQKNLNDYLEQKRSQFPRFYFISPDSLIEILSEVKDPLRVQKYLKNLFEGVENFTFNEEKFIIAMNSSEGEVVQFKTKIDTVSFNGLVEKWLQLAEDIMIDTVHMNVEKSYSDYVQVSRVDFVRGRMAQAVLCICMTDWTSKTETALKLKGVEGLKEYLVQQKKNLNELVGLIRQKIDRLDRRTLEALIVLDVHNRDVNISMIKESVSSISDFNWEAQLRYYWESSEEGTSTKKYNSIVRIINSVLTYNYEYLGNSSRLVITPLTDRCYRTLCGAIYMNYGGAPEGPAGTGKTETVKDLAKALARMCVVFNCSDTMDYINMARFFKGLASTGGWSCFDEFNRIKLEVLSVIAQQLQIIQNAIAKKEVKFHFDGTWVALKLTCNCFITMNPGYAGRSELPDNLKVLFRPVAMMVPNYEMISEIRLYSYGFEQAPSLAKKIVATYRLCSEQLSNQKHYDYGMRAVISVITAAGNLKKRLPDEDEEVQILKAINEVNLAKFLNFDAPLFQGITKDLFPTTELPPQDFDQLLECIQESISELKLKYNDYFLQKILQIYQMILVRHGLMVVGEPFGGKTSAIKILASALGKMSDRGLAESKVDYITINPKSIFIHQLYGIQDMATGEWFDGILPVYFKDLAKANDKNRKWMLLDGPVDAVWIENMNTVLDDNKKLCLGNGDTIFMSPQMNMIFEPMDLLVASPATVSRCGMIYIEPHIMGWEIMYDVWLSDLPKTFTEFHIDAIDTFKIWIIKPLIKNLKKGIEYTAPSMDQNLLLTFFKLSRLKMKRFENSEFMESLDIKEFIIALDCLLVSSIVWSFGAAVTSSSRRVFDSTLKRCINSADVSVPDEYKKKTRKIKLPETGMIFDYKLNLSFDTVQDKKKKAVISWIKWSDMLAQGEGNIDHSIFPHELIVKTADTLRYSKLIIKYIKNNIHLLVCGPTGTGKTLSIQNILNSHLDKEKYVNIELGFSAQTTCNQTQEILDSQLPRISKGVFGPKLGKKAVIFVDDLNMPAKQEYGDMPPIELLRQMIDNGGWYDYKEKEKSFKKIVEYVFAGSMGPPGGGRQDLTPRFQRHLAFLSFTSIDEEQMIRIFSQILNHHFVRSGFDMEIQKHCLKLVHGTFEVYDSVIETFKSKPATAHYLFNLRDFAKVIFGICLSDTSKFTTYEQFVKLWIHEIWRVFGDRLNSVNDRLYLLNNFIKKVITKRFGMNLDTLLTHLDLDGNNKIETLEEMRGLIFTDVMTNGNLSKRPYEEAQGMAQIFQSIENSLRIYNTIAEKPLDIVLFNFAIEHILIVSRILKQPGGHALLIGVGGSGRQSLTTLAGKIADFDIFQIELKKVYGKIEWRDDLKKLLKNAGGKNIKSVFLFTDTQIKEDTFVEDINNLLNTGDVPNLWENDERAELSEYSIKNGKDAGVELLTSSQINSFFVKNTKKHLHIVLCFSPLGDAFRKRINYFPSLVNCTTIDWFFEWPQEALLSVAQKAMQDLNFEGDNTKEKIIEMIQYFHQSTKTWAQTFLNEQKRRYYVTPTSYIEMINQFKILLETKEKEVDSLSRKYENGYQMIIEAESSVGGLQQKLTELIPELAKAKDETEAKMVDVEAKKQEADKIKAVVSVEREGATEKAKIAKGIQEDCQKELDKIKPKLDEAMKRVNEIKQSDITFLKGMRVPNKEGVGYTMQALCYIFHAQEEKKRNAETAQVYTDWWATSVKLLQDMGLLQKILKYNEQNENIEESVYNRVNELFRNPDVAPHMDENIIGGASPPCAALYVWINCQLLVYDANKLIRPKKIALKKANDEFSELQAKLDEKERALNEITNKVNALNNLFIAAKNRLEKLQNEYNDSQKKLERAKILIENLGDEKERWNMLALELKAVFKNLTGDILLSAGLISYLGPFTAAFRSQIIDEWAEKSLKLKIPGSLKFSFEKTLGEPVKIRQWIIDGLPSDSFSIQNAIIIKKASRYSLNIDPQNQANLWIRKMDEDKKLQITRFGEKTFSNKLENSIRFGQPLLIESIGEELDPMLYPVLIKQYTKNGMSYYLKIGDQNIEFNESFFLYMTTKLRNPHYLPEISTKVSLINFMITFEGLSDQLLGFIVKNERNELEVAREKLIQESAKNKEQLQKIEDEILQILSLDKKLLLDDEKAINILTASKATSNDIKAKQIIAEKTEKEIDVARQSYKPLSEKVSCLFFAITDLGNIDPMYQYSLPYFTGLFNQGLKKSEISPDIAGRLNNIEKYFIKSLFSNVSRSLFVKDKLLFSFLLTVRLKDFAKEIPPDEYRHLLTGVVSVPKDQKQKPAIRWLSDKTWNELNKISQFSNGLSSIATTFSIKIDEWQIVYDSPNPQNEKLPEPYETQTTDFEKLLVIRALRPDKLIQKIQEYVIKHLGMFFIQPPPFDIASSYNDSTNASPLIFVLTPGADPFNNLKKFAAQCNKIIEPVSLGQGQGEKAKSLIDQFKESGNWVVLQNCHLVESFMPDLERKCEELTNNAKKNHADFRLWLTSYPVPFFPVSILQNGVKMTNEPPKGLKTNLLTSYSLDVITGDDWLNSSQKPKALKSLLFGLCFFHAVIQERRNYGPLGWNIPYEFTESDLRISVMQLKLFLDKYAEIPFDALRYLTAQCNYGGRVTDDKDRRLIITLLNFYYNTEVVESFHYQLSENDSSFKIPSEGNFSSYITYVEGLPINVEPDVFGFHRNASITKELNETNQLLDSLLLCQSNNSSGGGDTFEQTIVNIAQNILSEFPSPFNVDKVTEAYPSDPKESMNIVLTQELTRFNLLIRTVHKSLDNLMKGIKGETLFNNEMEATAKSIYNGKIPDVWMKNSYPSLKPLTSYVNDLKDRINFFQKWIDNGKPISYWLSGFYFTQSFLTGVLQNFARKYITPIDQIEFEFEVIQETLVESPEDGAYVYGMFLEGAKWNYDKRIMDESDPKILFVPSPILLLKPTKVSDINENIVTYLCPLYKTTLRRGVLSTTGHSTNFVMNVKFPTEKPPETWIKRGVALITQLDD